MNLFVFLLIALLRVIFHPQPEGRPIRYDFHVGEKSYQMTIK